MRAVIPLLLFMLIGVAAWLLWWISPAQRHRRNVSAIRRRQELDTAEQDRIAQLERDLDIPKGPFPMRNRDRGDRGESRPSTMLGGAIILTVLALIVGGIVYVSAWEPIGRQELALVYGGGPLDANVNKFKKAVGPGGRHNVGIFNRVYKYPVTNRTWIIDAGNNQADIANVVPVQTKSGGADSVGRGAVVGIEGTATFRQNAALLQQFHERYGLNKHTYEGFDDDSNDTGWVRTLRELFYKPLQSAISDAGVGLTYDDFQDPAKRDAFNKAVSERFMVNQRTLLGGDFYCGPLAPGVNPETAAKQPCNPVQFAVAPPTPDQAITDAGRQVELAKRRLEAARIDGEAVKVAQASGLTGGAYVANECRKAGPKACEGMTFIFGGSGQVATAVAKP